MWALQEKLRAVNKLNFPIDEGEEVNAHIRAQVKYHPTIMADFVWLTHTEFN